MSGLEAAWNAFWRELAMMLRDFGYYVASMSGAERVLAASLFILFLMVSLGNRPARTQRDKDDGGGGAMPLLIGIVIVAAFGAGLVASSMPGWGFLSEGLG